MKTIQLIVYGVPIPQGSMRAFNIPGGKFPVVTADNKRTKPWKQEIAGSAAVAMQKQAPFEGVALAVECGFYFDKPKSTKKSITAKITKPDVDKLARAVLDALTGTVFKDDSQVTYLKVSKHFDVRPRVEIDVSVLGI